MQPIKEKLLFALQKNNPQISEKDREYILEDGKLISKGYIDSISLIEFVSTIEEEFEIEFEPNDMEIDNFDTFSKIVNTIESKIKEK